MALLIISVVLGILFLAIFLPIKIITNSYKKFVLENSVALKNLEEINERYKFKKIPDFSMSHSYDNENFYGDISCMDYLTYQLVYIQNKVQIAIKDALDNKVLYENYKNEVKTKCHTGDFGSTDLPTTKKRLAKYEMAYFRQKFVMPIVDLSINVRLNLTNINGRFRTSKQFTFTSANVLKIITKLKQKRGSFYLDSDIWNSICRVERGKVSNKMRFAIYERDHYRCRICGRRTNDLEIDHIIPIAKGGKSTFDNLQTLCHRCNVKKGDSIY